jgi:hypothetical protein
MKTLSLPLAVAIQLARYLSQVVLKEPQLTLMGMYHTLLMSLNCAGVSEATVQTTPADPKTLEAARNIVTSQAPTKRARAGNGSILFIVTLPETQALSRIK